MNRPLTAVFAALEALLVVGIGVGLTLVPLSLLWAFEYGLQVDWVIFWRVAADAWLIGHGVDVHFIVDGDLAALVGVDGAVPPFTISIAALGFALLTLVMSVRTGRRIAETPHVGVGLLAATLAFALLSLAIVTTAEHPAAQPLAVQGVILPTLVFTAGLTAGALRARQWLRNAKVGAASPGTAMSVEARVRDTGAPSRSILSPLLDRVPFDARVVAVQALRGGAAAVASVMVIAAVASAALIAFGFADIISLYESVHAGVLGGIAVTLGQLALVPNFVIWAASWFVGPGFAIGTGSTVGPLGTALGPMPVVPILGAIPVEAPAWGFVGLLVPVIAGFVAGVAIRPALHTALGERAGLALHLATGIGIGISGGVLMGLLALASGGAVGPGRLVEVGPDALLVGALSALEFGVAASIGIVAGRRRDGD